MILYFLYFPVFFERCFFVLKHNLANVAFVEWAQLFLTFVAVVSAYASVSVSVLYR